MFQHSIADVHHLLSIHPSKKAFEQDRVHLPSLQTSSAINTVPRNPLSLRGGGGVFEGQLRKSAAVGEVSRTLASKGLIGATCGDPANVPTDITCNQHQDSLLPSSVFQFPSSATPGDVQDADLNVAEWHQQARNFVRAHVERGAAMVAEGSGASLVKGRAILARFDGDGDGLLQQAELQVHAARAAAAACGLTGRAC